MYFKMLCILCFCPKRKNTDTKTYDHPLEKLFFYDEKLCNLHYYNDPYNVYNIENISRIRNTWTSVECPHCISNCIFI